MMFDFEPQSLIVQILLSVAMGYLGYHLLTDEDRPEFLKDESGEGEY